MSAGEVIEVISEDIGLGCLLLVSEDVVSI